ncbi:MAG: TetR/AcrR family transcriptional regulator [Eubacteriales bacterium]|nr:TetR/AcrR family transcriptional regulator [Eubacteriales bacterium]
MAKQIEGVSEKIESCARKEFLEKGYMEASLRIIAAEAGTTTGSIYSRYGGKEGLFSAIVEPVAKEFLEIFRGLQEEFTTIEPGKQRDSMEEFTTGGMRQLVDYMYDHFDDFHLLITSAYGTKFQDFVEHLVELETDYTYRYMETVGLDSNETRHITRDFMHIMNKSVFESFFEVIRHEMSWEEAIEYVTMLEKYRNAGWEAIYAEYC